MGPRKSQLNQSDKSYFPGSRFEVNTETESGLFKIIKNLDCQVFVCRKNADDEYIVIFSEGKIAGKNNICND